jgi:hypothetical protein
MTPFNSQSETRLIVVSKQRLILADLLTEAKLHCLLVLVEMESKMCSRWIVLLIDLEPRRNCTRALGLVGNAIGLDRHLLAPCACCCPCFRQQGTANPGRLLLHTPFIPLYLFSCNNVYIQLFICLWTNFKRLDVRPDHFDFFSFVESLASAFFFIDHLSLGLVCLPLMV